ncbi:MAG: HAD family hydrolase [Clostridia bacterium]|nr:HAD family hydrolase [Clostridia bacterium]
MNYYIDFDQTLFDTPKLTERMLQALVDASEMDIMEECKKMFNRENIYNIYKLIKYFADKYNLSEEKLKIAVNSRIYNCSDLVYKDSIPFIQKLKEHGHKIYMLSYCGYELQFQYSKIAGSNLVDLFDAVIVTQDLKYKLDINYQNGIFIDDNPEDLVGLYSKNPKKVIRLRRKSNKYSEKEISLDIEEYENLGEILI